MALSFDLTGAQEEFLSEQALTAIDSVLHGDTAASPRRPSPTDTVLNSTLGAFVTLQKNGQLRGCIGRFYGHNPLWLNVWEMARAAAFEDPRFPALSAREWPEITMDISVLDAPTPCTNPSEIAVGRDGLILQAYGRSGVFLPQVPVEQGWDLEQYLFHLCLKAGLPPDTWQKPEARLFSYQAKVFPVRQKPV